MSKGIPLRGDRAARDTSLFPAEHSDDLVSGEPRIYHLPDGETTGEFVRYNSVTGAWEVSSEPVVLKGLVLTPALASLIDAEGAIYYNSTQKAVLVCTEV